MRPDQTKAHWDAAYETRPPERQSWYQPAPSTSLGLIQATGLQAQEPLIDVGAGASSLVGSLLNRGFRDVTVLDVSSTALDASLGRTTDPIARATEVLAARRPGLVVLDNAEGLAPTLDTALAAWAPHTRLLVTTQVVVAAITAFGKRPQ